MHSRLYAFIHGNERRTDRQEIYDHHLVAMPSLTFRAIIHLVSLLFFVSPLASFVCGSLLM